MRMTPLRNMRTDSLLTRAQTRTHSDWRQITQQAPEVVRRIPYLFFILFLFLFFFLLIVIDALPPGNSPWPALATSPFFRIERLPRARVYTSQPAVACFFFPS